MVAKTELDALLGAMDEAFERKAWHGPNLRGSIRGLDAGAACWRPGAGRHSIWEIVVHAAYWKYAVRRRLVGDKRGSFSFKGSNWFSRPDAPSAAALDPRALHRPSRGSRTSAAVLLRGIAFHDVYHAGQIQLLKRLVRT